MTENNKIFYVYEFRDPRKYGTPVFYVGKGSGGRIKHNGTKNTYLRNKINKIGRNKIIRIKVKIFYGFNSGEKAYKYEQFLINWYGLENLCNVAEGGGGSLGIKHTEEAKRKISDSHKGLYSGEKSVNSKLSWKDVEEIRNKYENKKSIKDISKEFNVSATIISKIIDNKMWIDPKYERKIFYDRIKNNSNKKLSLEEVLSIRERYDKENISCIKLAKEYAVTPECINNILNNKSWFDSCYQSKEKHRKKLNWIIIQEIRYKYNEKEITIKDLAIEYNINRRTIYDIINNLSWKREDYNNNRKLFFNNIGENNSNAKLNWEIVKEIRKRYNEEDIPMNMLAKEYNISKSQISNIINNKSWIEKSAN